IVNGNVIKPFSLPNIVSIQLNNEHSCGGTLLTGRCVVTAAHCTKYPGSESNWQVKAHRHDLNKTSKEENGSTYRVLRRIDHPFYNPKTKYNDIAVYRIDSDDKSDIYRTDWDWEPTVDTEGEYVKVSGWGVTKYNGVPSQLLQTIDIPIYPANLCEKNYVSAGKNFDRETQFCGGDLEGGRDACTGDSGGPLYRYDEDGNFLLLGCVSWGIDCGVKGKPGIYTK
ncbi:trypsin-like serine protease, partial [Conidiobolus coronatus NRRL 28638]